MIGKQQCDVPPGTNVVDRYTTAGWICSLHRSTSSQQAMPFGDSWGTRFPLHCTT